MGSNNHLARPSAESEEVFKVSIDYAKPLADMIAAGKYEYVNDEITAESFPLGKTEGIEVVEIQLVPLGPAGTTDEVLAEFDRRGLRPATLPELLALGAAHPNLQRRFWMVALGSSWRDSDRVLRVPDLGEHEGKRLLGLDWGDPSVWAGFNSRSFAAVRK